jgi:hypothetical protein
VGSTTGAIAGTVPSGIASFSYQVVAANTQGSVTSMSQVVTVVSSGAPAFTSSASATFVVGTAGSFLVTTTGSPAPTMSEAGVLPRGLRFVNNMNGTATLAGTPNATASGTYGVMLKATNSSGTVSQNLAITVNAAPAITSVSKATFTTGVAGSFVVRTTGLPVAGITASGLLPAGVTFTDGHNGTATIAGTAGAPGVFPITITATNSVGHVGQVFTLTVNQLPLITSPSSTLFVAGRANTFTVNAPSSPVAVIAESGTLPKGVKLVNNKNGTATLSGTPAAGTGGTYNLSVTAKSAIGSATQSFTLLIATATATVGSPLDVRIVASTSTKTVLALVGVLPNGVTFTDDHDGSFTLSGTPGIGSSGTYALTLHVTKGATATTQAVVIVVS